MKNYWVHIRQNSFWASYGNSTEWFFMKLSFIVPVVFYLLRCLAKFPAQPYPVGICNLIDCTLPGSGPIKFLTYAILATAAILYVWEKAMLFSTFTLFLLSLTLLSLEESNGYKGENGLVTLLLLVQFLAYLFHAIRKQDNLAHNRVQYSIQIIAAVYILSGISKMYYSGISWFMEDAPGFILEVQRVCNLEFAATGFAGFREKGNTISEFLTNNPVILHGILFFTVVIELGSFIMLFGKKYAFGYAFLFLGMHIGIYLVMDIFFPTIMIPMLIFAVNPVYLIWASINTVKNTAMN